MSHATDPHFDEWVEETYRRIVSDAEREGTKRADAEEATIEAVQDDVAAGRLTVPADAVAALVRSIIERNDDRRRREQVAELEYYADLVTGDTLLGAEDPRLDMVCVIGYGVRKAWRHVNIDELLGIAERKVDMAAKAAVAAQRTMAMVTKLRRHLMATYGADAVIGDLAS